VIGRSAFQERRNAVFMYQYSRYFLKLYLIRFAWVFFILQLFIGLWGVLALISMHPLLPIDLLLSGLIDLMILAMPISMSLSIFVGGLIFIFYVQQHDGFFWIRISGKTPIRFLIPIILSGIVSSVFIWWLVGSVTPKANYFLKFDLPSLQDAPRVVDLFLTHGQDLTPGFLTSFESTKDASLYNFTMHSKGDLSPTIITAQKVTVYRPKHNPFTTLLFENGRLIAMDNNNTVTRNICFQKMQLKLSEDRLFNSSKNNLLALKYYTNSEMDIYIKQAEILDKHGVPIGKKKQLRIKAVNYVYAFYRPSISFLRQELN